MVKCSYCETWMDSRDVIRLGNESICPYCGESLYLDKEDMEDTQKSYATMDDLKKWGVR